MVKTRYGSGAFAEISQKADGNTPKTKGHS
jgi:hypothetical protein